MEGASADEAAGVLLSGTAQVLAGLLAAGLLDEVGSAERLPDALASTLPAEEVYRLFQLGARVGFAAGYRKGQRRWDPTGLAEAEQVWRDAGDVVLARMVCAAAAVVPPRVDAAGAG